MTEPAIRVSDVTKIFATPFRRRRRIVALQHLNLEIAPGEIYGLLGPNGSGKSTTLKIILGLIEPTSGSVRVFGRDNSAVAVRRDIGFLPENAYFHKFLTGAETLRFHAKLSGLSGRETKSRVAELLATVGLARAADARLGTYSKGMLQRIGLAQALIHHPKILVLDEPTAAVDPAGSRYSKSHRLFEKTRHYHFTFIAFAHSGAGSLRSRRHFAPRQIAARGPPRRFARD